MTEYRLYILAYSKALEIWGKHYDVVKKNPNDSFARLREERSYAELEEIRNHLIEIEGERE